ncbi:MAG: DUF721 domain-containing protein [Alphaproteobacteria bacterium]|jgi:hypothetical protein|nr:DUF721 domain-containing protein [Alphaproteobacteria bacterium]
MKDAKNLFYFLEKLARPTMDKKGIHLVKLLEDWQLIMPLEVKDMLTPSKIVWNANNQGVLYVRSKSSIINHILLHKRQDLITKINAYFGYNCIVEIKFIT